MTIVSFCTREIKIGKYSFSLITLIWFLLAIIAVILEMLRGLTSINNYLIYEHVFHHLIQQKNLYAQYPTEYSDSNHYGPFFSFVVAPFALMPTYIGCFFWVLTNVWLLWYAIKRLHINEQQKALILLLAVVEMMTAAQNVQFNIMLTGMIVLSYVFIEEKRDFWAALFIVIGIYTKLLGIVGLAFFFFSHQKVNFIVSLIFWAVVLFCLPMLISSPSFVIKSYADWLHALTEKNVSNIDLSTDINMQDISVLGMIRRIFNYNSLHNWAVLIPAGILFCLPYLRFKQFKFTHFRLHYLAITLITMVIFNTSSESPTYIIAVIGAAVWFSIQQIPWSKTIVTLLCFMLVLTSLSSTDLFPKNIKDNFIVEYSLKALPCFILWLVILYHLLTKKFHETFIANHVE
jgi:hypothetical protein